MKHILPYSLNEVKTGDKGLIRVIPISRPSIKLLWVSHQEYAKGVPF
jgi:hypothetical protein